MKSILKNTLIGLLFIVGTTKPVATLDQVKTALINLIPADGKILDSTLKNNIGDLNLSYPLWLGTQINRELQKGTGTDKCTVWNGLGGLLPFVMTISSDHLANEGNKLIVVTEDGTTICGIQFTIKNNEYTAKCINATDAIALLNKNCVHTERGFSVYQLPLKWILGAAAVVGGVYGGYRLLNWYTNNAVTAAVAEALKAAAAKTPVITTGQAAGVLASGAGNVIGEVLSKARGVLTPTKA